LLLFVLNDVPFPTFLVFSLACLVPWTFVRDNFRSPLDDFSCGRRFCGDLLLPLVIGLPEWLRPNQGPFFEVFCKARPLLSFQFENPAFSFVTFLLSTVSFKIILSPLLIVLGTLSISAFVPLNVFYLGSLVFMFFHFPERMKRRFGFFFAVESTNVIGFQATPDPLL